MACYSEGLHALADALRTIGEVTVVAPLGEASAIGHALTIARPLRLERLRDGVYSVDGTPADCVNLGVVARARRACPTWSCPASTRATTSATTSPIRGRWRRARRRAARRAGHRGVAAADGRAVRLRPGRRGGRALAAQVLRQGLPPRTLLNVNVPRGTLQGVKVTVQGMRNHVTKVAASMDPRGRPYYWIEEGEDIYADGDRADHVAVREGYVSVTPLQPDLTALRRAGLVGSWSKSSTIDGMTGDQPGQRDAPHASSTSRTLRASTSIVNGL